MKTETSRRGFTLIELLIVVAIIAILAAIAVPNFLEAQTRSKVSRCKADMRSLATAIEAYCVDNNLYPYPGGPNGYPEIPPVSDPFETHIPTRLTTPIAYITSLIEDPFKQSVQLDETRHYNYGERNYFILMGNETDLNAYCELFASGLSTRVRWYLLSHGPDLDHDDPEGNPAIYDPTNGTVSNGDILYFGPGIGFNP